MAEETKTAKDIGMKPRDMISLDEKCSIFYMTPEGPERRAGIRLTVARVGNMDDWRAYSGIMPEADYLADPKGFEQITADWGIRLPKKEAEILFALYPISSLRYEER